MKVFPERETSTFFLSNEDLRQREILTFFLSNEGPSWDRNLNLLSL